MQLLNSGGSLGTITGAPGVCDALLFAATYIQWLNAAVVIGLPDMSATEFPGTPLPHAARPAASTKKAPSAAIKLRELHERRLMVASLSAPRRRDLRSSSRDGQAACRVVAVRLARDRQQHVGGRTTAGNRFAGSSGTRIDSCDLPDSYSASGISARIFFARTESSSIGVTASRPPRKVTAVRPRLPELDPRLLQRDQVAQRLRQVAEAVLELLLAAARDRQPPRARRSAGGRRPSPARRGCSRPARRRRR